MAFYKNKDVRGMWLGEEDENVELACRECMTQQEWDALAQGKVIHDAEVRKSGDHRLYFCDRCEKRLTSV